MKTYRQWADAAWARETGTPLDPADDFAAGFRDGFVDYVYAGGDGEPPPVPPRRFWNLAWRTQPGQGAAQDWFAGYRHGADVARAGGYREQGVVLSAYRWGGLAAWEGDAGEVQADGEDLGDPLETLPTPPVRRSADESAPAAAPPDLPVQPLESDAAAEEHPFDARLLKTAPSDAATDAPASRVSMQFRRAAHSARVTPPASSP